MRIMVVDDDRALLRSLAVLLEQDGHSVRTFGDPRAALLELDRDVPDVLLLDYRLPEMTGLEFLRAIGPLKMAGCRVLLMSGQHEQIEASLGDLPDVGRLPKPMDLERLRAALERVA